MTETTIYHNPRCSKSRATLALLEAQGIHAEVVKYLETPPDAATLSHIIQSLGIQPRDLLRTGEAEYKDNGFADTTLNNDQLIHMMVQYPKVIERPIVVHGNQARIGRPPESVLEIF